MFIFLKIILKQSKYYSKTKSNLPLTKKRDCKGMNFDLQKHTILLNVAGSRSYGIHRDESDIDVKGVCIPPPRFIIGCLSKFEQVDSPSHIATFESLLSEEQMEIVRREKLEGTVYTLQKFLRDVVLT